MFDLSCMMQAPALAVSGFSLVVHRVLLRRAGYRMMFGEPCGAGRVALVPKGVIRLLRSVLSCIAFFAPCRIPHDVGEPCGAGRVALVPKGVIRLLRSVLSCIEFFCAVPDT